VKTDFFANGRVKRATSEDVAIFTDAATENQIKEHHREKSTAHLLKSAPTNIFHVLLCLSPSSLRLHPPFSLLSTTLHPAAGQALGAATTKLMAHSGLVDGRSTGDGDLRGGGCGGGDVSGLIQGRRYLGSWVFPGIPNIFYQKTSILLIYTHVHILVHLDSQIFDPNTAQPSSCNASFQPDPLRHDPSDVN
jgi:hypothetical protein